MNKSGREQALYAKWLQPLPSLDFIILFIFYDRRYWSGSRPSKKETLSLRLPGSQSPVEFRDRGIQADMHTEKRWIGDCREGMLSITCRKMEGTGTVHMSAWEAD